MAAQNDNSYYGLEVERGPNQDDSDNLVLLTSLNRIRRRRTDVQIEYLYASQAWRGI
jgi:hypothetical protein